MRYILNAPFHFYVLKIKLVSKRLQKAQKSSGRQG